MISEVNKESGLIIFKRLSSFLNSSYMPRMPFLETVNNFICFLKADKSSFSVLFRSFSFYLALPNSPYFLIGSFKFLLATGNYKISFPSAILCTFHSTSFSTCCLYFFMRTFRGLPGFASLVVKGLPPSWIPSWGRASWSLVKFIWPSTTRKIESERSPWEKMF